MVFYDKNVATIHDGDRVMLDCEECELIQCDDIVECTVHYNYEVGHMVCRDSNDNPYNFIYRPSRARLSCLEIVTKSYDVEDEGCLI